VNETLYFVVGKYDDEFNPCIDFNDEILKKKINITIRKSIIDTNKKETKHNNLYGLGKTRVDEFVGMEDIIESINYDELFVNALLKIASDLCVEIYENNLYGTFLTWTYEIYDSGSIKYPLESDY
jgi:hypothetical protein